MPFSEKDVAIMRELFPNAEERIEVVRQEYRVVVHEDSGPEATWVDVRLPVSRCRYPTMDIAAADCPKLPDSLKTHLEAATVLHEEEFEVLAEYHSRWLLVYDYLIRHCCGGSDHFWRNHHNARLNNLARILGQERTERILDRIGKSFDPMTNIRAIPQSELHSLEFDGPSTNVPEEND
jgi:hypothetical protein